MRPGLATPPTQDETLAMLTWALMKLTFWGAAGTVTGSMHLLETGGNRFLLDCGLYQGRRKDADAKNRHLPFAGSSIDAVVLSIMNDKDPGSHPNQRAPLAYENEKFLNGPDGRILRILAEYQEPLSKFRRERIQDTIVFFGSARFRSRETAEAELRSIQDQEAGVTRSEKPELLQRAKSNLEMSRYYEDARELAFLISKWTQTIAQPRHRRSDHHHLESCRPH